MKNYRVTFVNAILDSIHGLIHLTDVENQIERLPVFRRLQDISQLGLVKRIFPCAVHSRYSHSLGVMFVADEMAKKVELSDDERQVIRLAALLHDIGHYPLSHDIERVYSEFSERTCGEPLKDPSAYKIIEEVSKSPVKEDYELAGHMSKPYHHESIGALLIRSCSSIQDIIKDAYINQSKTLYDIAQKAFSGLKKTEIIIKTTDAVIDDICSMIIGNAQHVSVLFPETYTLMVQILHSEMDADQFDYLLRDASFSGTTYGIMDMNMLIDKLKKQKVRFSLALEDGTEFGYKYYDHYVLGVVPKGIGCVDQFLLNRYQAYSQVIHNKYTSIIGAMLRCAVMWLLDEDRAKFGCKGIHKMVAEIDSNPAFLYFTDNYVLTKLNEVEFDKTSCPPVVRKAILALRNYRAFSLQTRDADHSFVGQSQADLIRNIKNCSLFDEIEDIRKEIALYNNTKTGDTEKIKAKSFQYRTEFRRLTNQLPLREYNDAILGTKEEAKDMRYFDRLLNGIPIIDESERPMLVVDSEESLMSNLFNQQYVKLRKYILT